MNNKSNLEILQDIKKEYKPNNAFGNVKLIKLLDSIVKPNKKGKFETYAVAEEVKILSVNWKCVDCGKTNYIEFKYDEVEEDDIIEKLCFGCQKEHKLTIAKE